MNGNNAMNARKISNTALRQDNWILRKNLKHIIRTTKRNIDIQTRIDELGELIVGYQDVTSLVVGIATELKEQFGLNAVTFCLSDEFMECVDTELPVEDGEGASATNGAGGTLLFMDRDRIAETFKGVKEPLLREKLDYGSVDLFGMKHFRRVRSEAIVPLYHEEEFMGSLNLGCKNPLRYQEGTATDYLRRLGQILSLTLALMKLKNRKMKGKDV
ncbi:MAG: hypothetical protein ACE5EN_00945 [Nitrospinota bacterium]